MNSPAKTMAKQIIPKSASKPKVSVIILNWNQPELSVKCTKSVLRQGYKSFEIVLTDNASSDNSLEIFKKRFDKNSKVKIVANPENLGYAGGNNEAAKHCRGKYIAILNNDAIAHAKWLENLVKALETSDKISAVSSREIRTHGKIEKVDYSNQAVTSTILGYSAVFEDSEREFAGLANIFGVRGVAFIYRKNLVNHPFDADYFMYAEDHWLGWLLALKGYENKLAIDSLVTHSHATGKRTGDKKTNCRLVYLGERNRLMNLFIFYEQKNILKLLPLIAFGCVFMNIAEPQKILCRLKSYLWLALRSNLVLKKRKFAQSKRKVSDEMILRQLSSKICEESLIENKFAKAAVATANFLSRAYCRALGIRTVESR